MNLVFIDSSRRSSLIINAVGTLRRVINVQGHPWKPERRVVSPSLDWPQKPDGWRTSSAEMPSRPRWTMELCRSLYNNNTSNYRLSAPLGNFCYYCGDHHQFGRQFCRAANIQCYKCSKIGHQAQQFRSTPAGGVYANSH